MKFDFLKKSSAIYFYLLSVLCLVFANIYRDTHFIAYILLLVFGIGFSVFGFLKSRNSK